MNLLANQLTLAAVELRSERKDESLKRLIDTCEAYCGNSIVHNNLAVSQFVNKPTHMNQQVLAPKAEIESTVLTAISSFQQSITLNPLNYIPYYNLFCLYGRENNLQSAYHYLVETISALKLQRALKENSQKLANQVYHEYCSQSVLVNIVRAIVHVRNQKYVMALGDLISVSQNLGSNFRVELQVLELLKILYRALGEKDKQASTEQQIIITKTQIGFQSDISQHSSQKFRLVSTCPVPSSQQELKTSLSTKLKEFSQLIKQRQINTIKVTSITPQVLYKQINSTDLLKSPTNIFTLLRVLKSSVQQSSLFNESSSRGLSRSKESVFHSINQSREFGSGHGQIFSPQEKQSQSPERKLSMTIKTPNQVQHGAKESIEQSDSKRLNSSLNISGLHSSGLRGKKKTQNIYPLQIPSQQVQIKLVMAQLTNNKQLVGNMDPYCILTYNGQKKQSTVIKGGGLQPKWKQSFVFNLSSKPSLVKIQVYDKEGFFKKDDFVGSGTLLIDKNGFTKVLIFEGKLQAGTVFVTIEAKM